MLLRLFILFYLLVTIATVSAQQITDIQRLLSQKKFPQALTKIELFLKENPNNMQYLLLKANTLQQAGKSQQAIVVYHRLIRHYPERPEAYNNLAVLFAEQGELERAKKLLQKGLETDPRYLKIYKNINNIYLEMARDSYIKALRLGVKKHTIKLSSFQPVAIQPHSEKNRSANKPTSVMSIAQSHSVHHRSASNNQQRQKKIIAQKPKPKPKPKLATIMSDNDDIIITLQGWAAAWSAQDARLYLSFYGKNFKPTSGFSRHQWAQQRQLRLSRPHWIDVRLSDFKIKTRTKNKASVIVTQVYRSNSLRDRSIKKIDLYHSNEGWQILSETNIKDLYQ